MDVQVPFRGNQQMDNTTASQNTSLPLPRLCLRVGGVGNRLFGTDRGLAEDSAEIRRSVQRACEQVFLQLETSLANILEDDRNRQPRLWPAPPALWRRWMCGLLGSRDRWGLQEFRERRTATVFGAACPLIRVLTGGAEGADQLISGVAAQHAAVREGRGDGTVEYRVELVRTGAPRAGEYSEIAVGTIPEKSSAIRSDLLSREEMRQETTIARQRAYGFRAQSEALRHHSDLLVAIWDDDTEGKAGGTWETVQLALAERMPVVAIVVRGPQVCDIRVLERTEDLTAARVVGSDAVAGTPAGADGAAGVAGPADWATRLDAILGAMLRFPDRRSDQSLPPSGYHPRAAFLKLCGAAPIAPYWTGRVWKSFDTWARWLVLRHPTEGTASIAPEQLRAAKNQAFVALRNVFWCRTDTGFSPEPVPAEDGTFETVYEPIRRRVSASRSGLSGVFGDAYRGGIVASYLLAAVAVLLAVLGAIAHSLHAASGVLMIIGLLELMSIVMMVAIAVCSEVEDWNSAWTESRILAEALRMMQHLGPLGIHTHLPRLPQYLRGDRATPAPESMWSVWYFRALVRNAPLRLKSTDGPLEPVASLQKLITDQQKYHRNNAHRQEVLHHAIEHYSLLLFAAVLVCVILHLLDILLGWHVMAIPGLLLCVGGPVLIASLHGMAAQLEITRLRQRSSSLAKLLEERLRVVSTKAHVADPDSATAHWGLATEALTTTSLLIDETAGWSMLYTNTEIHVG